MSLLSLTCINEQFVDLNFSQKIIIPQDYDNDKHLHSFLENYDKWLLSVDYREINYRKNAPHLLQAGECYRTALWQVSRSASLTKEDVSILFREHGVVLAGLRALTVFCHLCLQSESFSSIPSNKWLLTFDHFNQSRQLAYVRHAGCKSMRLGSINTQAPNFEQTRPLWNDICLLFGLIPC
jgi:hypothetical protein